MTTEIYPEKPLKSSLPKYCLSILVFNSLHDRRPLSSLAMQVKIAENSDVLERIVRGHVILHIVETTFTCACAALVNKRHFFF